MRSLFSGSRIALLIGVISSFVFLALAIRNVEWESVVNALKALDYLSLAWSLFALFTGIFFRAARWRLVSGYSDAKQGRFLHATTIGFFYNLILPGRAGDILRIFALSKQCRTSLTKPLASALIDRIADVVTLIATTALLYFLLPINSMVKQLLSYLIVVGFVLAAGFLFYFYSARKIEKLFVNLIGRWLKNWSVKLEVFMVEFRSELKNIMSGWISFELIILLGITCLSDYWALSLLFSSLNLELPFLAPLMLWVFLAAGSALPAAPGYVGVYQAASVLALSFFDTPPSIAVVIATLFQIINLILASVMMASVKLLNIK